MSEAKKSWRDVYGIHPAADLFPLLAEDELRAMGEDIKKNGLQEQVVFWSEKANDLKTIMLLDGRNRLDAMELVGMETLHLVGEEYRLKMPARYLSLEPNSLFPDTGRTNPFLYAISKNVHRRHLTKLQKAELIVQAVKLEHEQDKISQSLAKSTTRQFPGAFQGGGSTKDEFKNEIIQRAANVGISKRTAENALAKDRGPVQKPRQPAQLIPRTDILNIATDRLAREVIAYLEDKFRNAKPSTVAQVLTAVTEHFQPSHEEIIF